MEKKTKLTISGSPKKAFKDLGSSKSQGKKTVIIERQSSRSPSKGGFTKQFTNKSFTTNNKFGSNFKPNFPQKTSVAPSDFEKRKLAEQRATKKLKSNLDGDKKSKLGAEKRQVKLTVSRALSDEIETRERSLASVKRARQKELKNVNKEENQENEKIQKNNIQKKVSKKG